MIEIVLRSGQVLKNDPKCGFNSNSAQAIRDSLEEFGCYQYFYQGGNISIPKKEVVEVREV